MDIKLCNKIHNAIVAGNVQLAIELTNKFSKNVNDAHCLIKDFMIPAMNKVGKSFENGEIYVPQMLMSARAMKGTISLLKPFICSESGIYKGKIVIGTVKGDLHDLGKNLIATMLEGAGFKIINLGVDVGIDKFMSSVEKEKPDIIALSTLLTTTICQMENIVRNINKEDPEKKIMIMVGGSPITLKIANELGADGYSSNANGAVKLAEQLLKKRKYL